MDAQDSTAPLPTALQPAALLQRLGEAMRRYGGLIRAAQWVVVLFYAALVIVPAFLPLPAQGASIVNNLTLLAQFLFWGIWWPFVMLSMMLMGRVWCGTLCPEGSLTEFVSRRGLGRAIPRWMRWSGWPFFAFVMTTVYGQLISVYEYPKAVLLILGGSTAGAIGVGYVYGKGKRVWCRYLCPANGVFGLLAKLAPVHFRVSEEAWKRQTGRVASIDCAPLIDLRHMKGGSECHACGRCSGHRDAIALSARSPNREVLALQPKDVTRAEALLLIYGVLGVAVGAFQWTLSPWFVAMKTAAAEWLVARDSYWLLQDNAPWWLLTHYPDASDVFTWLDGLCILAYIGSVAIVLGSAILLCLSAADRVLKAANTDWKVLAMTLIPIAGIGAFLGLSMLTVTLLKADGVTFGWIQEARGALLFAAIGWSVFLGLRRIAAAHTALTRRAIAGLLMCVPSALMALVWYTVFFVW